jgi:hypothetical protein
LVQGQVGTGAGLQRSRLVQWQIGTVVGWYRRKLVHEKLVHEKMVHEHEHRIILYKVYKYLCQGFVHTCGSPNFTTTMFMVVGTSRFPSPHAPYVFSCENLPLDCDVR